MACVLADCFLFKQKTAYEMRISDWSSDVCSSDLAEGGDGLCRRRAGDGTEPQGSEQSRRDERDALHPAVQSRDGNVSASICGAPPDRAGEISAWRSEEHTSELQSLMRISYAVFCLKKKKIQNKPRNRTKRHTI